MTGHVRKRVNKGATTWQITLDNGTTVDGKRKRDSVTIKGTKKEALQILNEKLNDYNKGTYITQSKITTEEYLLQFLESYCKASLKPNTLKGYTHNIEHHILPEIGSIPLQKLSPLLIQKLVDHLVSKGLGPRGTKYVHATLHKALEQAVRMQLIPRNHSDFAVLPKKPKSIASSYEEDEVQKMLVCAKNTDLEVPLLLAVGLGVRRGELLALKWHDINLDNGQLTVCRNLVYIDSEFIFSTPKTESGNREISIPSSLISILKRHNKHQIEDKLAHGNVYQDNDLVVCHPDGSPYKPPAYSHKFTQFLRRNKLRVIRLHDLRHTNASLMLSYNIPIKVVSQRLGHSTSAITMDLYTHVIGNLQHEAAQKLDEGIFQKLGC